LNLKNINSVFFLGIGGIGMSALARYFASQNITVHGYDKTNSNVTDSLEEDGIKVVFKDELDIIDADYDLIIYTPAIPNSNKLLNHFKSQEFEMMKRAEVLGLISKDKYTIAIAGTHGKTSVSAQVAHLLKEEGYDCTGFVGGICRNYDSNYIEGRKDVVVIEADEFDRSFLHLSPDLLVITSLDPDHLDIYGDFEEMKKTFLKLISKVKPNGKVLLHDHVKAVLNQGAISRFRDLDLFTYASESSDYYAKDTRVVTDENGERKFEFNLILESEDMNTVQINIPGIHNVDNTVAAISVTQLIGLDLELVKKGVKSFEGIKRRFDYHVKMNQGKAIYIDDYAHHPNEINVTIDAVRRLYPKKKLTTIFQPHLFTRTKDFAEEFCLELSKVDQLVLLPIYPAREEAIPGVNSEMLLENILLDDKRILEKEDVMTWLANEQPELVLTLGAGDIDQLITPIKNHLSYE
jgi:UDP-N-acetylmuramate--alanine ligase